MLKAYIKNVLISFGAMSAVFMFASFINTQIFDINFFRMLMVMGFIITTSNHIREALLLPCYRGRAQVLINQIFYF